MSDIRVTFPKPCDEPWGTMETQGCHRRCDVCDQTIFDLEKLTVEETEALLDSGQEACVRARVAEDGIVASARGSSSEGRVLKAAMGAAASLAIAACATSDGPAVSPRFTVEGSVPNYDRNANLILTGAGRTYKRRPRNDGSFRFMNLTPGTYTLKIADSCSSYDLGEVTVSEEDVSVGQIEHREACIIVGKMKRAEPPSYG